MKASSPVVPTPLSRRGAWLIDPEAGASWQMHSVEGPLEQEVDPSRQFFRVETSGAEILLISRRRGERGMRELHLESIFLPTGST